jgi:hypothetical protein
VGQISLTMSWNNALSPAQDVIIVLCVLGQDFAKLRLYWTEEQPRLMVGVLDHNVAKMRQY